MPLSLHPDLRSEVMIRVKGKEKKTFEELTFLEKKEVITAVRKMVSEKMRACADKTVANEEFAQLYYFAEQLDEALKDVNNVEPLGTGDGVSEGTRKMAYQHDERRARHKDRKSQD